MTAASYPNAAMADICAALMDEWGLTQDQIAALAKDLAGECAAMADNRAESAWMAHQDDLMAGGTDDRKYRDDMTAAGRGHLLRG